MDISTTVYHNDTYWYVYAYHCYCNFWISTIKILCNKKQILQPFNHYVMRTTVKILRLNTNKRDPRSTFSFSTCKLRSINTYRNST